jgi:hypothetical protein
VLLCEMWILLYDVDPGSDLPLPLASELSVHEGDYCVRFIYRIYSQDVDEGAGN